MGFPLTCSLFSILVDLGPTDLLLSLTMFSAPGKRPWVPSIISAIWLAGCLSHELTSAKVGYGSFKDFWNNSGTKDHLSAGSHI